MLFSWVFSLIGKTHLKLSFLLKFVYIYTGDQHLSYILHHISVAISNILNSFQFLFKKIKIIWEPMVRHFGSFKYFHELRVSKTLECYEREIETYFGFWGNRIIRKHSLCFSQHFPYTYTVWLTCTGGCNKGHGKYTNYKYITELSTNGVNKTNKWEKERCCPFFEHITKG